MKARERVSVPSLVNNSGERPVTTEIIDGRRSDLPPLDQIRFNNPIVRDRKFLSESIGGWSLSVTEICSQLKQNGYAAWQEYSSGLRNAVSWLSTMNEVFTLLGCGLAIALSHWILNRVSRSVGPAIRRQRLLPSIPGDVDQQRAA